MKEIDEYIDKYCKKHKVTREDAEKHAIVKAVTAEYVKKAKEREVNEK